MLVDHDYITSKSVPSKLIGDKIYQPIIEQRSAQLLQRSWPQSRPLNKSMTSKSYFQCHRFKMNLQFDRIES
jgi:hypothetical protein